MLSGEMATAMTGRHIDFTLLPFSFHEYLSYKGFEPQIYSPLSIAQTKNHLQDYLKLGGFPLAMSKGSQFLSDLYRDILERDVIMRYKPKNTSEIREVAKYLISNSASEFTYNKLKEIVKIKSVHTIKKYIQYLESAYLVFQLSRFSFKLKEQLMAPKKIYCIDVGLASAISLRFSDDSGKSMENSVAIHLLRRMYNEPFFEFYYWKDYQQREVDFVLKRDTRVVQLIQVCKDPAEPTTMQREINSLLKASCELKCSSLLVITWDVEREEKIEGKKITFVPLWKYLLEPPLREKKSI